MKARLKKKRRKQAENMRKLAAALNQAVAACADIKPLLSQMSARLVEVRDESRRMAIEMATDEEVGPDRMEFHS